MFECKLCDRCSQWSTTFQPNSQRLLWPLLEWYWSSAKVPKRVMEGRIFSAETSCSYTEQLYHVNYIHTPKTPSPIQNNHCLLCTISQWVNSTMYVCTLWESITDLSNYYCNVVGSAPLSPSVGLCSIKVTEHYDVIDLQLHHTTHFHAAHNIPRPAFPGRCPVVSTGCPLPCIVSALGGGRHSCLLPLPDKPAHAQRIHKLEVVKK